jgi:hypothetical protein
VFEITATPTPMNNDTRVLNTKALDPDVDRIRTEWRDLMTSALKGAQPKAKTLDARAKDAAQKYAAIQVASFDA